MTGIVLNFSTMPNSAKHQLTDGLSTGIESSNTTLLYWGYGFDREAEERQLFLALLILDSHNGNRAVVQKSRNRSAHLHTALLLHNRDSNA